MQLALSTPSVPPPIPVWGELSGNLRQGFTTKNQAWNPGPNVVNSTTQIGLQASLFLEGFRQSHSARYYNPITGRFMSRDPENGILTDPSTLHKYIYAGGDPVNAFDPSGRNTLTWPGAPPQATSPTRSAIEYVAIVGTISLGAVEGVKAVTCAINIANTVNALRTPTGSFAGITVNLPGCTASKNCQPFEDAIQRAMGLVLWRYQELLTDRNQLYCKAYDYPWLGKYPNGPGTWLGHLQAFRQAQGELIKAILAANAAGCPIPPQAWELAYMPPPICPAGRIPRP